MTKRMQWITLAAIPAVIILLFLADRADNARADALRKEADAVPIEALLPAAEQVVDTNAAIQAQARAACAQSGVKQALDACKILVTMHAVEEVHRRRDAAASP